MKRRDFLQTVPGATLGLGALTATAGCLSDDGDYDVGMQSNAFVPETIEISVGDEVVWKNTGSRNHTVTAYESQIPEGADYFASGDFTSEQAARDAWAKQLDGGGDIRPGASFSHAFEVAGTYAYFCIPHEPAGMVGTVVVTE